jgi:hypothetical protein
MALPTSSLCLTPNTLDGTFNNKKESFAIKVLAIVVWISGNHLCYSFSKIKEERGKWSGQFKPWTTLVKVGVGLMLMVPIIAVFS